MASENNKRPPIPDKPQWLMRRSYSEHSFPKKEQKGSLVQQRLKQFSIFQNDDDEENKRKPIDFGTDYNRTTSPLVKRRQTTNDKVIRTFLSQGSFTNYVDKILAFFDHLPTFVDIFYGMNVDKNWTFLDHLVPTSSCKRK